MLEFTAFELLSQCGHSKTCAVQDSNRSWAGIDLPGVRRSTRVRVPIERGLDYQLPLRKKNYNQCKKKLEDKLNALDMSWTELSDAEALRKERTFIEDYRKALTEGSSEFVLLLPSEYANDVARETDYLNRQAMELRKRIGERIFELEKVELRTRRSGKRHPPRKVVVLQSTQLMYQYI